MPNRLATMDAPPRRRRGGFFWGLALGLVAALAVIVGADLGLAPMPRRGAGEASAASSTAANGQRLLLTATLSPGMRVLVDGREVPTMTAPGGTMVELEPGARKVEVRSTQGPLWSARIDNASGTADTLSPVLGGEIVVEADRAAPRGALFLDDVLAGTPPATLSEVTPGWHRLSIRDGAEILYESACVVTAGHVTLVTIPALPPHGKGAVTVRSRIMGPEGMEEGSGDRVWVDGERMGSTPFDLMIPSGFHSIRVERSGFSPFVDVLYVEAGRALFVDAQFGGVEPLTLVADPPAVTALNTPVGVPVSVTGSGESVTLTEGSLCLVRPGQPTKVIVPLVDSGTDSRLWVAVIPAELTAQRGDLTGYVVCADDQGRRGVSEIFQITVR